MGVWIETQMSGLLDVQRLVTPFVGVWIETRDAARYQLQAQVTPFVGVWIETLLQRIDNLRAESHPSWVCGLKLADKPK